ncbi:hypothetical protein MN116_002798 [Schistosoma mekongi]|uniref:G-protein coupled receptors family 1 profile domain-containing protein n=1 Tax=Schistosoma mekongi TaxID=38744 RepID=A0AAE2D6X5_SCHME|nr:hypothetical protein MN116_002798 [Schistosoma mekongi]
MTSLNDTQTYLLNDFVDLLQLFHLVRTICMQGLIPVVCIIGISTNMLNILVLARPRMHSSTNKYLLAVAVCDLFYGITLILLTLRTFDKFETYQHYMHLLPYLMAFGNLCSNTACWLTCAFTVERYIAVSAPILARKVCTKRNCKWIILVLCLFTFSVTLPDFLSYTVKWSEQFKTEEIKNIENNLDNIEDVTFNGNQTHLDNNKITIQQISIRGPHYILTETKIGEIINKNGWPIIIIILVVIGPLIILSVFNGLLIKSILQASKTRLKMTKLTNEVVLPKIRYGIIYPTETVTNYTKENSDQFHNDYHHNECYTIKNSLKNQQLLCKHKKCKSFKQNITITGIETDEILHKRNNTTLDIDEHDNLPINIHRSYNTSSFKHLRKFYSLHRSRTFFNEKDRITLMLILIVVTFCLLTMPSALLHLIKVSHPYINQPTVRLNLAIAGNFVNLSLAINSTLNFFFYSWLSRRFRKTFYNLLKCD